MGQLKEPVSEPLAEHTKSPESRLVSASDVISALSYALDLTEGQPLGHSVQSCMIGMRLAQELGLGVDLQADLYYALLLKDAGCSNNASKFFHIIYSDEILAKGDLKEPDWTRVGWESLQYAIDHVAADKPFQERVRALVGIAAKQHPELRELAQVSAERGASIARRMGFSETIAAAIQNLDEHWNGGGYPNGLRGEAIPLFSRIMNLSQSIAVFLASRGTQGAEEMMERRSRRWFDPEMVKAAKSLVKTGALWEGLDDPRLTERVAKLEPVDRKLMIGEETLDDICAAFAEVIDAKSPFTYGHSIGVARVAVAVGEQMGMADSDITSIRRAALLHDIGKLSVSNAILEKPGKLAPREWEVIKKHPHYTLEILRRIPGFEELSDVAAAHHEKLNGTGYHRGWAAEQLNAPARILAVSDIFDALTAKRPYRDALPLDTVFELMHEDTPHALDVMCLEALEQATSSFAPAMVQ